MTHALIYGSCSGIVLAAVQPAVATANEPLRSWRLLRWRCEVRCIEVILARNADQREQRIATSIGERCSHPMRGGGLADRANRPIRGDPFARRMRQYSREV